MIDPTQHLAILALYSAYNRAIDAGDAESWVATFVEDGVFHHPARIFSGVAELQGFIQERTAKFSTNSVVAQEHWNDEIKLDGSGDVATGSCRLLVVGLSREGAAPQVVARGQYQDRLIRTPAGWRFQERRLTIQ